MRRHRGHWAFWLLLCCVQGLWAEDLTLRTADGLLLEFTPDGMMKAVVLDGTRLGAEGGGLYIKDVAPEAEPARMNHRSRAYPGAPARGVLTPTTDGGLRLTASLPEEGLTVEVRYRAFPHYIRLDCQIENVSARERALIAYFRLPLDLVGARWWRNLQEWEPIDAAKRYLNPYMTHQAYRPWASTSMFTAVTGFPVGEGGGGLSLVVPMEAPRWFRTTYEKPFGYQVEVELGLSPLTRKFPNRASFSALLYRVDPRWGLRSTVERYYQFFPDYFVRRIEKGGTWYFDHPEEPLERALKEPEDFALRFKETYVWSNEDTRAHGILTMKYMEPWCDHYCGTEEWMRKQAQDLPANNLWAPSGKSQPIRVQAQALLISGVRLPDGSLWGPNHAEFRNRNPADLAKVYGKHWPQVKQVLETDTNEGYGCRYPTNPDIELPGMCRGKSVLQYEVYNQWGRKPQRPEDVYDGIYYDSTSGWWTGWHLNNFNREHFPYADFPLIFDPKTGQAALLHGLSCIEFLRYLTEKMRGEGWVTMGNSGPGLFINFCAPYLDMMGAGEAFVRGDYAGRWLQRSVAGTKPLSYLKNPDITDRDFHECLPFAVYPGGPTKPADWERLRPLYRRFIPFLDRLDRAGWQPVPCAQVQPEALFVERFGPEQSGTFLLVVHNRSDEAVEGRLDLLPQELARRVEQWTGSASVKELLSERELPVSTDEGTLHVAVALGPKESAVLEVTPVSPASNGRPARMR